MTCGSGHELKEKGYEVDVELAARLNASESVPTLRGNAFVGHFGLADAQ